MPRSRAAARAGESAALWAFSRVVPSVIGPTPISRRHLVAVWGVIPHQRQTAVTDSRRTASAGPPWTARAGLAHPAAWRWARERHPDLSRLRRRRRLARQPVVDKTGYELWLEMNGTPVTPIRPERSPHKVITRAGSLTGNVEDPTLLWAWTVRHVERLIEELQFHNVRTADLGVQVAWKTGDTTGGSASFDAPTDRFDDLLEGARVALRRAYVPHGTATHLHVLATALRRGRGCQLSLFDRPDPKRNAVAAAKAAVNDRFGRFKVRPGATLLLPAVYKDPANDFDVCDVRGKICF